MYRDKKYLIWIVMTNFLGIGTNNALIRIYFTPYTQVVVK